MSDLTKLYAERDLLRSRRATLERKLEELVLQETRVRLAINDALKASPRRTGGSSCTLGSGSEFETTREDVPEFFSQRTVD